MSGDTRRQSALEPECCAVAAAAVIAAADIALLLSGGGRPILAFTAAAVVLFTAALLAAAARLSLSVTGLLGPRHWIRSAAGAVLALIVIIPVSTLLFRGTGISTKWYAPYGPFMVTPPLFLATVLGLWAAGRVGRWVRNDESATRGRALAPLAVGAAGLLGWLDLRFYPNQYGYIHWTLLLCTALALMAAAWLLLPPARWAWRRRRICCVLLWASVPAVAVGAAGVGLSESRSRQLLAEQTHAAGRLVTRYRLLLDRDGDLHSVIFGENDCDNSDPRVHPFAPDIPGNGLDEDCDGVDAKSPAKPKPSRPEALDGDRYRVALRGWLKQQPLGGMLAQTAHYNVVLIVLDSLRQDQTVPNQDNRRNHPNIIRLLTQSGRFIRAFSNGSGTDIGMATVFTGQLDPFAPDNRTLFQELRKADFRTYGVFQREVSRWVGRQFAIQSLDHRQLVVNDPRRRDVGTHATAAPVTDHGIRLLERHLEHHAKQRFFLWLHYFDIHEHHQIDPRTLKDPAARSIARGRPFYRRMVRHVDQNLGRFLDALRRLGLWDRTILVTLADHGEGLAEQARLPQNHGDVLYTPLIHVPLGFRIPGVRSRVIDTPVTLADIQPTLLDLAGVERGETYGHSLVPFLFGAHRDRLSGFTRPLFLVEAKQKAVIHWPWKFMTRLDQGMVELYNLEQDLGEERNLVDDLPAVARRMSALLGSRKLITIDRLKKRKRKR